MIAHHTAGGCLLWTGDLLATGTVSSDTVYTLGCLPEMTINSMEPYAVFNKNNGTTIQMSSLQDEGCIQFHGYVGDS